LAKASKISSKILKQGFRHICTAKTLTEVYEENFKLVSKYVHATSRGHEAIQVAAGMQLLPQDYLYPYYRDDALLLGMKVTPLELMLQLFAKESDPFSEGRLYYSHPSLKDKNRTKIPFNSSATGMQAIPATGAAMGLQYKELVKIKEAKTKVKPIVVCSLGDASITEGEVAEAFQMAALKQLPILYLIQDNEWDISASADEIRAQDAYEYIQGFKGIEAVTIDGNDFNKSYKTLEKVIHTIRKERRPFLVHAKVPLLNHHTSGVRMEWYRDDLDDAKKRDPYPIVRKQLLKSGVTEKAVKKIEADIRKAILKDFEKAQNAKDPNPSSIHDHIFAETPVQVETGTRIPEKGEEVVMVDAALHAVEEIMRKDKKCLLYGQDVGARLGGVFREAATLAQKFGDERVFNTPIQEAFIVGSTAGMSAVGLKPIVEVQFADYIWPGLNQLFTEVSRSNYLSCGKWPISMILRVPIGAYGSGGPYHSGSVESILSNIGGIKVAYPSNGADLKGLLKSAYHDPNPVVILEHKGLYWSKVPGTDMAKTIEPAADYLIPFGKARVIQYADAEKIAEGQSMVIISYGMGVHWAYNAAKSFSGQIEILDLRTISPIDYDAIYQSVKMHNRCMIVTEEPVDNSFAQSIAGKIQSVCFKDLDAPIQVIGSAQIPAIPLNSELEKAYLPSAEIVAEKISELLAY